MAQKVESYKSNSGKLFLTEENAVRHDAMESLCAVMPEFQMIRTRLEGNLDAIAQAISGFVDWRRRENHPRTTLGDHPETTPEVVALRPAEPVADGRQCPYNHPDDTRCPHCDSWENYVHRRPRRAAHG